MSTRNIDKPRDPRDDGSVRAIVQHQSLLCAPVTSTFSPSSTKPPSPSSTAVVVICARSDPAPASVYAMHAMQEPEVAAGRNRSRCASEPKARTVGATSTAAVSIMGASWYAASKLTTACQLRGLPPPPYWVGRLTPRNPAAPARTSNLRSNSSSQPVRSLGSREPTLLSADISARKNVRASSRNAARSSGRRRSGSASGMLGTVVPMEKLAGDRYIVISSDGHAGAPDGGVSRLPREAVARRVRRLGDVVREPVRRPAWRHRLPQLGLGQAPRGARRRRRGGRGALPEHDPAVLPVRRASSPASPRRATTTSVGGPASRHTTAGSPTSAPTRPVAAPVWRRSS